MENLFILSSKTCYPLSKNNINYIYIVYQMQSLKWIKTKTKDTALKHNDDGAIKSTPETVIKSLSIDPF